MSVQANREQLKSDVRVQLELVRREQTKLDDLLQEVAEAECPHWVGQETTVPLSAFSHAGKKCRVTLVRHCRVRDDLDIGHWKVWARVLKKDGTDSKLTADWNGWPD